MNKIVLGTAQFGMDYGINNKKGKISLIEAFKILNRASNAGIDTIDTAYAYGESEKVLGDFIKSTNKNFKIISKLPKCRRNEVKKIFLSSLNRLGLSKTYGYLMHDFNSFRKDERNWKELEELKREGRIKKIGFSCYFPYEIEYLLNLKLKIDIIQIPFSIFDQRFIPYFGELQRRKIKVYARSIFLQGLAFKKPGELEGYFSPIKSKLEKLNSLSNEYKIPVFALCLNYALKNKFIDKVIVGVDNSNHFSELIKRAEMYPYPKGVINEVSDLRIEDERFILPFNWRA